MGVFPIGGGIGRPQSEKPLTISAAARAEGASRRLGGTQSVVCDAMLYDLVHFFMNKRGLRVPLVVQAPFEGALLTSPVALAPDGRWRKCAIHGLFWLFPRQVRL